MSAVFLVTNAPVDYDWGWARTEIENYAEVKVGGDFKPVRLVRVTDEYHAERQAGRYGSGLNFVRTQTEFLQECVQYPDYQRLTPSDQTRHYYRDVTFPREALYSDEWVYECYGPLTDIDGLDCDAVPNTLIVRVHSTDEAKFSYAVKTIEAGIAKLRISA